MNENYGEAKNGAMREVTQIESAMRDLEKAVESINCAAGKIDAKTLSAQRPNPPVPTNDANQKDPVSPEAPLAKSIRAKATAIMATCNRLESIANLIELPPNDPAAKP
jgi:hypothetical protein